MLINFEQEDLRQLYEDGGQRTRNTASNLTS